MATAIISASASRRIPVIISPHIMSRREFIRLIPGINSIMLPIITISICCPIPTKTDKIQRIPATMEIARLYTTRFLPCAENR